MINYELKSIRTFIGAKNYQISKDFYTAMGFEEVYLSDKMSLFKYGNFSFYLQQYYEKKWVDNSMVFLEVGNTESCWQQLKDLDLPNLFKGVRLSEIKQEEWGCEFFLHDPSGVLWHIGNFK